jgi:methylmalonyl-CoA mutase C-terminal domain/subunit
MIAKTKPKKRTTKPSVKPAPARTSPIRILIAKPGLDGHDRGAKVVARALRDAGMEVIYTGLHQTPEMIVRSALQEDVQCIGLSILSGAHMTLFPEVMKLLKKERADDIVVFGGGIIPAADIEALRTLGVKEVFPPGSSTQQIVEWVRTNVVRR